MPPVTPIVPAPGQESVWAYPRPPRLEPTSRHIRVIFNGITIADTRRAFRVLETSHPPSFYLPPEDIAMEYFAATDRTSFCEFKGRARYSTLTVGSHSAADVAWSYPEPSRGFEPIINHIAIYAGQMDACYVDDECVTPQPGDFYGGWITSDVVGPFKGEPGSWGW